MTKRHVLKLYKSLMRESQKFPAYNFRTYAVRRVRDGFKENKELANGDLVKEKLEQASKNLEMIKRQVIIGQLYSTDKLVIEHVTPQK